ncbi:hypothetical protein CEXT_806611 [Caerostris extrusa]|uniref:Ig-like domain-containing protein n=1 Tax=Caerostris extrusa TaxID=172846 RepID=A0AAV4UCC8_CAEEX|nr:hypothetical protein CEXT_806611 [Caerostris extrusa]
MGHSFAGLFILVAYLSDMWLMLDLICWGKEYWPHSNLSAVATRAWQKAVCGVELQACCFDLLNGSDELYKEEGPIDSPPPKGPEPQFADNIPNITIPAGRDVTLPCVVDSLGDYKVSLQQLYVSSAQK